MKLPLLARFKLHPSPRPITPEAALSIWNRATDDNRLSVRARFLLQRHCTLAIEELAPLPYSVEEIADSFCAPSNARGERLKKRRRADMSSLRETSCGSACRARKAHVMQADFASCPVCKTKFRRSRAWKIYCSPKCAKKAKRARASVISSVISVPSTSPTISGAQSTARYAQNEGHTGKKCLPKEGDVARYESLLFVARAGANGA